MNDKVSALWQKDLPDATGERLGKALSTAAADRPLEVFFRADDIGLPDHRFIRLMQLFAAHRIPLCPAIVPAWFDHAVLAAMAPLAPESSLWCWHQHGWDHSNHEPIGRKSEFGASRDRSAVSHDLARGRSRLARILGPLFVPVFTPPWNRCSQTTLSLLKEQGFAAVSRSISAVPAPPAGLPDLAVNVDLHTRREQDFHEGWNRLLTDIGQAAGSGRIGFMIHHQRMNDNAFAFLDVLLPLLRALSGVRCCSFRELLSGLTHS